MSIESKHAYRFGFLKSEEWKGIRLQALAKSGAMCFLCGKVDWSNDSHHKKYRKNWMDTRVSDLVILCRKDHNLVHVVSTQFDKCSGKEIVERIRKDRGNFLGICRNWARNPLLPPSGRRWIETKTNRRGFGRAIARIKKRLRKNQSVIKAI